MRKIGYLLLFMLAVAGLSSCSEDDNTVTEFVNWRTVNEQAFADTMAYARQQIASGNEDWKVLRKWSLKDSTGWSDDNYIVVHVLENGNGEGPALYTDSVAVNYVGRLMPSTSYAEGFAFNDYNEKQYMPVKLLVSGMIDGFSTALQHMHVGDRWMIYIPYNLAYGTDGTSNGSVPGYSMLRFDVKLKAIAHAGESFPVFKSKRGYIEE